MKNTLLEKSMDGFDGALVQLEAALGEIGSVRLSREFETKEDDFGVRSIPVVCVVVVLKCGCRKYVELNGDGVYVADTHVCRGDRPFRPQDIGHNDEGGVVSLEELPF